jgi:hypothetical protein
VDEHAARIVASMVVALELRTCWARAYAPPKRFAAQTGSALTIVATLLLVTGLHVAASLEAGLGFCLACWIDPFVFRIRGEARA